MFRWRSGFRICSTGSRKFRNFLGPQGDDIPLYKLIEVRQGFLNKSIDRLLESSPMRPAF